MERKDVYKLLDSERAYQNELPHHSDELDERLFFPLQYLIKNLQN